MIAIIQYNAGNAYSMYNALYKLGHKAVITADHDVIYKAERVIFPGVGQASTAMQYLHETGLDTLIKSLTQPTLGVCLGQQIFCQFSEENQTPCLGIFDVAVKRFPPGNIIPHIGWNQIFDLKSSLFHNIQLDSDVYFVHSYYCEISKYTIATCDYILPFAAAMQHDNFYATQFHVEKSGTIGQNILLNFLKI
jgi:glutamine amidotransferase